jgi:hypothetical protein
MTIKFSTNLKTVIKICFILFYLPGCSQNRNSDISILSENIEIDIDKLNTNGVINFSDLFENYEIIPLETTKESLIGKINGVHFIKDKIIILDRSSAKAVFLFDISGKFIRKIGKLGKGPGEYISPSSVSADEARGEIAVYDGMLNKILFYDINGEFLKSIQLKSKIAAKCIELYKDNIYISNYIHDLSRYLLYAIDIDGNIIGEWFPNTYPKGFTDNTQLSPSTIFFRTDKNLRFRSMLMNAVYNIESNSVNAIITLKSNNKLKQDELVELYNNSNGKYLMKLLRNQKFIGISGYSEIDDLIIMEYLNNAKAYVLFYNRRTRAIKCTTLLNFHDDMTNFSGKVQGFFHTSYDDKFIAPINGHLMDDLIENVRESGKLSTYHNLQNLTNDSNPCIIMYKCKKNPNL